MSRTWHHIKPKLFWRNYVKNLFKPRVPIKYTFDYNKNPSWWNLLFNRKPKRRQDTQACKEILNGKLNPEKAEFSLNNKPNTWYW